MFSSQSSEIRFSSLRSRQATGAIAIRKQQQRFQTGGAIVRLGLFAFSSLISTSLELLHCTEVPANSKNFVLLRAGGTQCGPWQISAFLGVAILLAVPTVPLLLAAMDRFGLGRVSAWVHQRSRSSITQALKSTLTNSFHDESWYWAAALTAQRTMMVAVSTIGTDWIANSVINCMIAGGALQAHVMVRPYKNPDVHKLQTLLGFLLFTEALASVPIRTLEQASVNNDATPELGFATRILEAVIGFSLIAPARGRETPRNRATPGAARPSCYTISCALGVSTPPPLWVQGSKTQYHCGVILARGLLCFSRTRTRGRIDQPRKLV
jgi:hypothetical protein